MSASEPLNQSSQKSTSNDNNKEPKKSSSNAQSLLVFQCKNCLKIIGDSICYLAANTKLRSIVLTAQHPNTVLGNEVSTSNEVYDLGCTFILLNCKFCKNKLGRVYKATNSKLDYLRDKYTYHIDNFTTYQLGSYSKSGETITQGEQILELGDTKPILESISRVKEIICAFHDRINKLESITNSQDLSLNNNLSQLSKIGENANNELNSKLDDGIIVLDEEEEEVINQLNSKIKDNDNNDYSGEQEEERAELQNNNVEVEEEDHNETYNGEKDEEESTNNRKKFNPIRKSINDNNNNNNNNNNRRELVLRLKKKVKYTR